MRLRLFLIIASVLLLLIGFNACSSSDSKRRYKGDEVMVTSLSSDGRFAITTNANRHAYLWNLKQHTQKQLKTYPVNIYSAYFIKDTQQFIIQNDKTNQVKVENTQGKTIKTFNPGFPSYGEVISKDLKHYYASDEHYNVFKFETQNNHKQKLLLHYCPQDHDETYYKGPLISTCSSFFSAKHLIGLSLNNQDTILTASGDSTLYIWNLVDDKHYHYMKNNSATFNAVSPNGHYVATGDVQKGSILYNLKENQLVRKQWFETPHTSTLKPYFKGPYNQNTIKEVTGLNFIDNQYYLVSFRGIDEPFHYLAMYKVNDVIKKHFTIGKEGTYFDTYPVRYLKLNTKIITVHKNGKTHKKTIYPETQSFLRSQSFDIAPQANRVVMGQANGGGIMVYQYDPDKQKLKLIWAPQLKEHDRHWWAFW